MKKHTLLSCNALVGIALTALASAEVATPPQPPAVATTTASAGEQDRLAAENKLAAERLTKETQDKRAEITRLKTERELLTERQALEAAKRQASLADELTQLDAEKEKLAREGELARVRAEKLANDLKAVQTEPSLELTRLQNEIARIETTEKRSHYTDAAPVYLKQPLKADGTLVISDRRIPLNGPISNETADYITERIQYWNNKDRELPIFIVIDSSPGGSVMAGYRILKTMQSSSAPVHVVVKSFAASMAAAITTLAAESYAYPNAVILHHQISSPVVGVLNLTQQREFHEDSQRWWARFGNPIANKMGITPDEFIKKMYTHASSGDWSEFGEDAQKLKWVNHVVQGIDETSITKDPDAPRAPATPQPARPNALTEMIDANGKPFVWLPRLEPMDVYFMYNPDGYYRLR